MVRRRYRKKNRILWAVLAAVPVLVLGFVFLPDSVWETGFHSPTLRTIWLPVLCTAAAAFGIWRNREVISYTGVGVLAFSAVLAWIFVLFAGSKWVLLLLLLYFWLLFAYTLFLLLTMREDASAFRLPIACWGVLLLTLSRSYNFPDGIAFWRVSLIISLLAAIVCAAAEILGWCPLRDDRISERILLPVAVFIMAFFLVWNGAQHLNYVLDTSDGERIETVIEEKTKNSGKTRRYSFTVTFQGETEEMDVSSSVYDTYEVGDDFFVTRYAGAFDCVYYLT